MANMSFYAIWEIKILMKIFEIYSEQLLSATNVRGFLLL